MKRLGIYFFYDKDGIVDNYVTYYLEHLKPFCNELCVVVNGKLTIESRKKLEKCSDKLIVRENIGFDSGAYKHAMEQYGYDILKKYDELILCNFTCFGPVYPFQEMFEKMSKRKDLDFWGISRYPKQEFKICGQVVTEHIMSFFLCIRKTILQSDHWKSYWDNLKIATNYKEAVAFNELIFTSYFTKYGFKSDTLIPCDVDNRFSENSPTFSPISIIKEYCPLVKRRAIFTDYFLFIHYGRGDQPRNILNYIQDNTDYDVNMIWDNMLRTQTGSTLKRNLHLNWFLDEEHFHGNEDILKQQQKVAMLCYCYYSDMLEYCFHYAQNLPDWADVYLFVVDNEVAKKARQIFSKLPNKVEVRIKENRGQLASAVLISGKDIFEKYDLVCVTQAKKTSQLRDQFASENFCEHCWEGVLKSPAYVLNLIQTYNDNPRMGYSCNFIPHWGEFQGLPASENTINSSMMQKLKKDFDLQVPFDDEPIASYGECYWVRGKGYKKLLAHEWKYSDFPEANKTPKDGCILNALERMMPIFVQDEGFFPAWIIPMSYASVYFDNAYFLYRWNKINRLGCGLKRNIFKLYRLKVKYRTCKLLSSICLGKIHKKLKERAKKYKAKIKDIEY